MNHTPPSYPTYAASEKIADGTMHLLGVIGAFVGTVILVVWGFGQAGGGQMAALVIYGVGLVSTFVASAFYNMSPWERIRPALRRIDHAAIYLKISATYTPLVVMIGSFSAYIILATVWALAVFGMVRKLFFWQSPGKLGTVLYLIMGWLSLALIWQVFTVLPASTSVLIICGGLLYSVGVVFYSWKTLKFSRAIWHGFVVAASACFYIAIALGVSHNIA